MNVTLDLNTVHPDLILSKGNKHMTRGHSYNQTSHRDLKARSTFQARRGSCQGGGSEEGKLGTGQDRKGPRYCQGQCEGVISLSPENGLEQLVAMDMSTGPLPPLQASSS